MPDFRDRPALSDQAKSRDGKARALLRNAFPSDAGRLAIEQFPSGHSNLTYLLRLGMREIVLRRPPHGSKVKTAHDMSREYRVLLNCTLRTRWRRRFCCIATTSPSWARHSI